MGGVALGRACAYSLRSRLLWPSYSHLSPYICPNYSNCFAHCYAQNKTPLTKSVSWCTQLIQNSSPPKKKTQGGHRMRKGGYDWCQRFNVFFALLSLDQTWKSTLVSLLGFEQTQTNGKHVILSLILCLLLKREAHITNIICIPSEL